MTDEIDRAKAREEEMRSDALAELARKVDGRAALPSALVCARCDTPIPEERRKALPGVQRCIECQRDFERQSHWDWGGCGEC